MPNENLARLLSRKVSGEATAGEEQELQHLLQENPGDQYFAELLIAWWHSRPDRTSLDNSVSPDQHFAHILDLAEEAQEPVGISGVASSKALLFRLKKLSVAAIMTGVIGGFVWWLIPAKPVKSSASVVQKNEVMAKKGAKTRMVLPDGTSVWLNSDSKLVYDAKFNDSVREVTLEGEAYFNVVKNAGRPFIVHTSGIDVRVLGTAFNVKSYPQEATIEATLIHGSIEVLNKKEPKSPKVILRPHEKLVFNKEEHAFIHTGQPAVPGRTEAANANPAIAVTALPKNIPDTAIKETSWVYNKLVFDGDTFRELAVKMERWFNVRISFKNEKVANYRLRGAFENESIEEALQALQFIASFTYKLKDNEVEISKK